MRVVVEVDQPAIIATVGSGELLRHACAGGCAETRVRDRHAPEMAERPALGVEPMALVAIFA
jgi:hypothetical protein